MGEMLGSTRAPPAPRVRVSLAVTGHRASHPLYAQNHARIEAAFDEILDLIENAVAAAPLLLGPDSLAPTRLHTLFADGTDQTTARRALARGMELISPLPFGHRLNEAINALPDSAVDARALLDGGNASDQATQARAMAIRDLAANARIFELADQDEAVTKLFLDKLDAPADFDKAHLFAAENSQRVAFSGRILVEQSDMLIAVWDAASTANVGGTGHTIAVALDLGAPVIWIDPGAPESWRILRAPESLATLGSDVQPEGREAMVAALVGNVLRPADAAPLGTAEQHPGVAALGKEHWRARSNVLTHAYRRVEALFGGEEGGTPFRSIVEYYETPETIASGSEAELLAAARKLPGADPDLASRIEFEVLHRFAWADGISAHLSDRYRGGMIVNFLLASIAIVGGVCYLPLVSADQKWMFALFELFVLSAILVITFRGQKYRWHGRWFETRRVAEYFRHSPLLLVLGVARAPGRWPRGTETSWPEWYVRQALRDIGLPHVVITPGYLRGALTELLDRHVILQRDYHASKARRLTAVHNNLDRFSEFLFQLAVGSVALYLILYAAGVLSLIDGEAVSYAAKYFTVLGVLFPTFGAALAGIRFFGDFERFAAISEVTAEKLDAIHARAALLLAAPDAALHYGAVAELAHATDDIVVAEIENWQAVFGGKHITVPV